MDIQRAGQAFAASSTVFASVTSPSRNGAAMQYKRAAVSELLCSSIVTWCGLVGKTLVSAEEAGVCMVGAPALQSGGAL